MKRIKPNSLQNIELTDGGILLYDEGFLPSELADRYGPRGRYNSQTARIPFFSLPCLLKMAAFSNSVTELDYRVVCPAS
jgi:hypothetical protein